MDLADLEMKISVDSQDAEKRLDNVTTSLNKITASAKKAASGNLRTGIFDSAVVKHIGMLESAVTSARKQSYRLTDMRKNLQQLDAFGSRLQSFAKKTAQFSNNVTKDAKGITNLDDRLKYLNASYRTLDGNMKLVNKAQKELGLLSAENKARVTQLTEVHNRDSKTLIAKKVAIRDYVNSITDATKETTRQVLAMEVERDALRGLIKDTKSAKVAQDAYTKSKVASTKAEGTALVKGIKGDVISDKYSGAVTPDVAWKNNIRESKALMREWDMEYKMYLRQLTASEKEAFMQFKLASKATVLDSKSDITNARYSGDISPDSRWQASIKDSKIAMRDWDATFKAMDIAERARAEEALNTFRKTWTKAKNENMAYHKQLIKNEKDAHRQFKATWGTAKAQQREYYREVKQKERDQAKYIQLTNQAMAWRLNAMRDLSILFRQVGMAFTRYFTAPFIAFSVMAVKFTAEMEMQQKAFEILLGSATEGARVYSQVVRYAAETPYQLPELTQATKELLAFGSSSATVIDELRRLGDIAQNDAEKLESVVQAFGKVQARGVAHMRELNRFIMAGVPIIGELGRVMNMGMDELFRAVQKGNVSFNAVKQAVENLTNEGGKFYQMSKEMSVLVAGRWSTLKDEFQLMARSFVEDLMPTILTSIEYVIDFTRAVQSMTEGQRSQIRTIALWVAAIGPALLLLSKLISFGMVIQRMIGTIARAWQAAKLVSSMNMLGATIKIALGGIPGIITAVVIALVGLAAFVGFNKLKKDVTDTVDNFRDLRNELENLNKVTDNKAILGILQRAYPKTGEYDIVNMELVEQFRAQGKDWDVALIEELDKRKRADTRISGLVTEYNTLASSTFKKLFDTTKNFNDTFDNTKVLTFVDIIEASGALDVDSATTQSALDDINRAKTAIAEIRATYDEINRRDERGMLANSPTKIKELKDAAKRNWSLLFTALLPSADYVTKLLPTGDQNDAVKAILEKLMPGVGAILEMIAMERKVFTKKVEDMVTGEDIFTVLSKQLLNDANTADLFGDKITESSEKIGAILLKYQFNTMEAIDEAGSRLTKYMADIPAFQKYYDAIFKGMTPDEVDIVGMGNIVFDDLKASFDALLPNMSEQEKKAYTLFESFFGSPTIIREFFQNYGRMLKGEADVFLKNLDVSYAIDNIKSQFSTVPVTSETRKSQAEFMLKGIEEQVKSFVQSKSPQTLEDVTKAVEEFFLTNKEIKKSHTDWLTEFNNALIAVDYDKEFSKLAEGIATYGQIGEAASAAVYKLRGFSDAQIATLSTTNQLKVGLEALQSMLDNPSVDTKGLIDILSMSQTTGIILPDTMSAENKTKFSDYFKDVYALDEQERLAMQSTEIYNKMAKELVEAGGVIIPDTLPSDVKTAVTKYFQAFYGMDIQEQAIEMRTESFKTLMAKLTSVYSSEQLNLLKSGGLKEYLTSLDTDLAMQVKNIGKTANEIAIERLLALKNTQEATDDIDILIDEIIKKLKLLDNPPVFAVELDNIMSSLVNTSLNSLISELEEVGKAFVSADFAGRNFGDTLRNIGLAIIDSLPQLFLQAGLNVLMSGNIPVGLGLIAMAGASAMFKGYAHASIDNGPASSPIPSSSLTFSAKGNAFDAGRMLSVPTLFNTSRGFNMGGELGTEAILPLTRTANGRLGVASSGAGNVEVNVPVSIEVINQTGTNITAETQTTTGPNGEQNVKMIIKKVVAEQMAKGEYDGVMRNRYGSRAMGVV